MRIAVAGAAGRMGQRILNLAAADPELSIGAAYDVPAHAGEELRLETGETITLSADARVAVAHAEVLIDFTVADAVLDNLQAASAAGVATVIGATGLDPHTLAELDDLAARVPVVYAPNMSLGVNLLFKLVAEVAGALGPEYNIEIVETHHNQKQDSPSGTAVRLAELAAEARGLDYNTHVRHGREGMVGVSPQDEIGVHALRGGDVAGEHTVSLIGPGERIELTHRAHTRDNFARGALTAAKWVGHQRPGRYDMLDVLGLR